MQGKSVEDIISEWDAELVKRSQSFTEHANALADWDRIILRNRQVLLDVEEHLCQVPAPILPLKQLLLKLLLSPGLRLISESAFVMPSCPISTRGVTWLFHVKATMHQGQDEGALDYQWFSIRADPLKSGCSGEEGGHARDASKGNS